MLFSLIILVLIGVIAYFHFLQGFFSATISAVLAVVGAVLAVGFHEVVANLINGGQLPDYVAGVSLVAIFAVFYILMRLLLDKAVPGNLHFPLLVDRIGAASMGVVAGVFSVGVFAIAAQTLPFGPSIAGYIRYPVEHKTAGIKIEGVSGMSDAVYDILDAEKFIRNEAGDATSLLIPVDELLLGLVGLVSREGGALDTGRPFDATHPDYLQELFGQRVGIQSGCKRTAMGNSLDIEGVFLSGPLPQDDPERWTRDGSPIGIRGGKGAPALPREYKPGPGKTLLVVRARVGADNADKTTSLVAFTPASMRLVASRQNHFPIGTIEGGRVLFRNVVDDPIFVPGGSAVDLAYEVPEKDVLLAGKDKNAAPKIAPDVFVELKRAARAELLKPVTKGITAPGDQVEVVRKEGTPPEAAQGSSVKTTLAFAGAPQVSDRLPSPLNTNTDEMNMKSETEWGTFTLTEGRFSRLEVNPVRTVQVMQMGRQNVDVFSLPEGMQMVQVTARPAGDDKWKWADEVGEYEIEDGGGRKYKPMGVIVPIKNNNQDMLLVRYDSQKQLNSAPVERNMQPSEVTLLFLMPNRAELKFVYYKNELFKTMQFKVVAQ